MLPVRGDNTKQWTLGWFYLKILYRQCSLGFSLMCLSWGHAVLTSVCRGPGPVPCSAWTGWTCPEAPPSVRLPPGLCLPARWLLPQGPASFLCIHFPPWRLNPPRHRPHISGKALVLLWFVAAWWGFQRWYSQVQSKGFGGEVAFSYMVWLGSQSHSTCEGAGMYGSHTPGSLGHWAKPQHPRTTLPGLPTEWPVLMPEEQPSTWN